MATATLEKTETNLLLSSLPDDEYSRLRPELEIASFGTGAILIQAESPIAWVYFPITLIGSVVVHIGRQMIEASTAGREGFVGMPAILGTPSLTSTVVQIPGDAYRIATKDFLQLLPSMPELGSALRQYALSVMDEAAQSAACNRAHPIEKRCAKWLLLIHDRVESPQFPVTHKYLATMLGVRRAGVTIAAGMLQKSNVIRYSRGKMTILDRGALESAACPCYRTVKRNRDRVAGTSLPELR